MLENVLITAIRYENKLETIKYLVEKGADINARNKVSMSVFYQNDTIVQTNLTVTSYAPVIPMTADFIKTPLTDNNDYSFTFSGLGQNTITNYSWDFGDGKTSTVNTVANKPYTFAYLPDDHIYTVTLTITSAAGCTASVSKKVVVPGVHITGTYDYTHSSPCTPPEIFTFTPKLTGVPPSAIYKWTYGDGYTESVDNSQSGIVHHQYFDAGLRSVTLSIYSKENILLYQYINPNFIQSFGQNATPIATFSYIQDSNNTNTFHFISHSTVQDGSITILYWDFGDITSQYGADVYKSYAKTTATYPVKLTATSNAGCSSNAVVYVKVQ